MARRRRPSRRKPSVRRKPRVRNDRPRTKRRDGKQGQGGRPRIEANPHDIDTAVKLAKERASNKAIAASLGISIDTFDAWIKRDPRFRQALEDGREIAIQTAKHAVMEIIDNVRHRDRLRAATAFLRTYDDEWRKTNSPTGSEDDPIHTSVELPDAQALLRRLHAEAGEQKKRP